MKQNLEMYIDITGPDGNMYFMLGKVSQIMRKARRINEFNELRDKIYQGTYYQGLYRINKIIKLIDTSEQQILAEFISRGQRECLEVGDGQ